jgi:4-hydroxy-tetrahydrodipicolinate synthase
MKKYNYPVYAIPPSFEDQELEFDTLKVYLEFLESNNAKCIMTTAGTSQFTLLTTSELRKFNVACAKYFNKEKILGLREGPAFKIKKEIDYLYENIDIDDLENISILLLFPERYYNDTELIKYFYNIADHSNFPILIHGNKIRRGNGGTYEYTADLINELARHPNIIGIKEECSSWDLGYELCRDIEDDNFNIIVAGGSQKRFLALRNGGANSFLTGIGNLNPELAETFYSECNINNISKAIEIVKHEKILFDIFMKIGWHASLRFALSYKGLLKDNRAPFVELPDVDKFNIINTLKKLEI